MTIRNLYLLDAAVVDSQVLLSQLPPDSEWHWLDKGRDGVEQIADIVGRYSDLSALHIISHGAPGTLYLGSSVIDYGNLTNYSAQLERIGASLTATGDILLYGCDVAADAVGKSFVQDIARLTGADVAASTDISGPTSLGGNSVLESQTGSIDAVIADLDSLRIALNDKPTATPANPIVAEDPTRWGFGDTPVFVLSAGMFGFLDVDAGDALTSIVFDTLPLNGTLYQYYTYGYKETPIVAGQSYDFTKIYYEYHLFPAPNYNGTISFDYQVGDKAGALSDPATFTLTLTPVNDAPTTANATYTIAPDQANTLLASVFPFDDVDTGDSLSGVVITALPTKGVLTLDGVSVAAGQSISPTDLAAGKLKYTPIAGETGSGYTTIGFKVLDQAQVESGGATLTLDVKSMPIAAVEDTAYLFKAADFSGLNWASVRLDAVPAKGTLFLDGVAVQAGQVVTRADIDGQRLRYLGALDGNGNDYARDGFTVLDAQGHALENGVNIINVAAVNDKPTSAGNLPPASSDFAMGVQIGDTNIDFYKFLYYDPDPNDFLKQIEIVGLTKYGDLNLFGRPVVIGQKIAYSEIENAGLSINFSSQISDKEIGVVDFRVIDPAGNFSPNYKMAFNFLSAGLIPSSFHGIVYYWHVSPTGDGHALVTGVTVDTNGGGQPPEGENAPIQFKNLTWDASGHGTAEVWGHSSSAYQNFSANLHVAGAGSVTFASNLDAGKWTVLANTPSGSINSILVGGFTADTTAAVASGDFKLGTVSFESGAATQVGLVLDFGQTGQTNGGSYGQSLSRLLSDNNGHFELSGIDAGSYGLTATRSVSDVGNAITSADALAALKIAVAINPNVDPDGAGPKVAAAVSPYQIMAADVVGNDGRVTSADALAILKMSVQIPTAPARQWMFVDERRDFYDETTGTFTLDRNHSTWDPAIKVSVQGDTTANLVGVLKGDVDGSWTPPAGSAYVEALTPNYFATLAQTLNTPQAQWGIV